MTFVPPRVATWRYQRGSRSLAANLSDGASSTSKEAEKRNRGEEEKDKDQEKEEDLSDDLLDALEHIVNHLLLSLRDKGEEWFPGSKATCRVFFSTCPVLCKGYVLYTD